VAKPDRVEVWDIGPSGLVFQADLEVWGSVVGIEKVVTKVRGSGSAEMGLMIRMLDLIYWFYSARLMLNYWSSRTTPPLLHSS
jgi:hypothetical protein